MNKVFKSISEAVADIPNGATILAGGFGLCGIPENSIRAIAELGGGSYGLEPAITGGFSIGKAWKGDRFGNLVYRHTAMNFNPMMATAAKVTIAEVEEIVEVGVLDPDHIHTPGIFVHRVIKG